MVFFIKQGESTVVLKNEFDGEALLKGRVELESMLTAYAGKPLVIDLSELELVNNQLLSLFLSLFRAAKKISCELSFVNMSHRLFDMARVGGIESFFSRTTV